MSLARRLPCQILLLTLASACASKTTTETTLYFGFLSPESGNLTSYATSFEDGLRVAQKLVNDNGGVLGMKLDFKIADSNSTPAPDSLSLDAFNQLHNDGQPPVVIGPTTSNQVLAVAAAAEADKTVLVAPLAVSPLITALSPRDYIFRVAADYTGVVAAAAIDMNNLGVVNVSVLASEASLVGVADTLRAKLQALNSHATVTVITYPELDDYTNWADAGSYAQQALSTTPAPDFIYLHSHDADAQSLVQALTQKNWSTSKIYAGPSTNSFPSLLGYDQSAGIRFSATLFTNYDDPEYLNYLAAYKAWSGNVPPPDSGLDQTTFDSAMFAILGAVYSGKTDATSIRDGMHHILDPNGTVVQPADYKTAVSLIAQKKPIWWHASEAPFLLNEHNDPDLPVGVQVCCHPDDDSDGFWGPPVLRLEPGQY